MENDFVRVVINTVVPPLMVIGLCFAIFCITEVIGEIVRKKRLEEKFVHIYKKK